MTGDNGTPLTPDWSLPKPLAAADAPVEDHLIRGEN